MSTQRRRSERPTRQERGDLMEYLHDRNAHRVASLRAQAAYWHRLPTRLANIAAHIIMERRLRNLQTAIDAATLGEV